MLTGPAATTIAGPPSTWYCIVPPALQPPGENVGKGVEAVAGPQLGPTFTERVAGGINTQGGNPCVTVAVHPKKLTEASERNRKVRAPLPAVLKTLRPASSVP